GTVSYMSPEQVAGDPLDNRTDLFSLGIVLYECATGQRPFLGKTSAVIFSAILNDAPIAPTTLNPKVPARLQEVITTCLEKDRELRYQDAAGLRADLRRVKRDIELGSSASNRSVLSQTTVDGGSGGSVVSDRSVPSSERSAPQASAIQPATRSPILGVA